jgi:hypothetical protein
MSYHEARIIYVDVNRLCCDTISIDGNFFTEDVSYAECSLKQSGDLHHPELGDIAVIFTDEDGGSKISRWYVGRSRDDNNLTQFLSGFGGNLPLNRHLPGDRMISGPDGAFLSLLRGKLSMMGSSPLCQTIYSGLEGLIRTVCQNYDAMGAGFRVFSINSGDEVITRLCFSGSDRNFINGANDNEDAMSENFEYQIDFTQAGITVFVGDIDPTTKKRNPNLTIILKPVGDIQIVCGNYITYNIFSNGIIETVIVDDQHNTIYNKTIGGMGGQLLYKEIIKGDVVRQIDGNLYEDITGDIERNANLVRQKAKIIDNTSSVNRKAAGINISELDTNPISGIKIS